MKKLKVGLIGVGNISEKAYLPVYGGMQDKIDFIVSSRTLKRSEEICARVGFPQAVEGVEKLFDEKVDAVMIHTPTHTHAEMCQMFLEKGISVFVDKPISETIQEVQDLRTLALQKDCLFMAGFNRRFAPFVQKLKQVPQKNFIHVSKNQVNQPSDSQFVLFDYFIHPLDTALFLLDEKIEKIRSKMAHNEAGKLTRAIVRLETKNSTAIVTMNLVSGAGNEVMEVQSEHGTFRVENLQKLTTQTRGKAALEEFPDWTPTLEKRGFDPMVREFFQAVYEQKTKKKTLEESYKNLLQEDTDFSHKIIAGMLK